MHAPEQQGSRPAALAEPVLGRGRTPFERLREWPWLPVAIVALLTAVGFAIRLSVAYQDYFADELSSFWIVSKSDLGDVLSTVNSTAEITPPLSFVLGWVAAQASLAPEVVRIPSLIAGVVTIPAVYLLGVRTVGRPAALVAAAFTALAPFMIFYSAEARGYALMMALVLLSTLFMVMAVDSARTRWWVAYAVCSCGAVYTHYTCVFVLGAQLLWVLWAHPEARRAAILANVGAVIAFLPWIQGFRNDLDSPTTDILSALQPFDWLHVRLSLEHWSIGYPYSSVAGLRDVPGVPALVLLGGAALVALGGLVVRWRQRRPRLDLRTVDRRVLLVVAVALSSPVGTALFSAFGSTTLFSTRNLAASWPGFALAFALLLVSAGPRLRLVAASLAILAFGLGAAKLLDERFERPQYEVAAQFVDDSARSGDVVIDETAVLSPGPLSHIDPFFDRPPRVFRSRAPQQRDHPFNVFDPTMSPAQASRRAIAAADGGRIFIVTDGKGERISRPMGSYELVETQRYPGLLDIVVQVWER
jgi:4-amino-4-deoxy-L-arabinose transferase-like glycosyltransferase